MKKTQYLGRLRTRLPNPATLALWPLVQKYGDHLRERQCKPNSIVTVQSNLKRFCAFITAAGHWQLAAITPLVLEGYQLSLAALTLRFVVNLPHRRLPFNPPDGAFGHLGPLGDVRLSVPRLAQHLCLDPDIPAATLASPFGTWSAPPRKRLV